MLKHRDSGLVKRGFYGFSWTTLFFGFFPALFRGDFITFLGGFAVLVVLGIFTIGIGSGIAMIVWAFWYNKYYTRKLLERGYMFADSEGVVAEAKAKLGVA
jgi:hypothetical protein